MEYYEYGKHDLKDGYEKIIANGSEEKEEWTRYSTMRNIEKQKLIKRGLFNAKRLHLSPQDILRVGKGKQPSRS